MWWRMKRWRWGWPIGSCLRAKPDRRPRSWRPNWPPCPSSACDRIGYPHCTSGGCPNPPRSTSNSPAFPASPPRPWQVPDGSRRAPGATAPRRVSGSAALINRVARPDVVHLRVTFFVDDGVVEPQHREVAVDLVEGDLVVGAADGHRLATAGDGQRVARAGHVQ